MLPTHDFVVGRWIPNRKGQPGALLLGEFVNGELRYMGPVGSVSEAKVIRAVARK